MFTPKYIQREKKLQTLTEFNNHDCSCSLQLFIRKTLVSNIQCKKNCFFIQNEKSLHELIDGQGQGTLDGWQVKNVNLLTITKDM